MEKILEQVIPKYRDTAKKEVTKLSDHFDKLPSGLFYKDETGMGATYLELTSKRNSIIVEPIKVTASSKAYHHKALYVGSETSLHPQKIEVKEIGEYLKREDIPFKKIVVVADSLHKVISAIGKDGIANYFLLIDEIDSVQLDSSFRAKMESVIDTYKRFPKENRAMVSATSIAFTDPELSQEKQIKVKYDEPTSRNIKLYYTDNIKGAALTVINQLLTKFPNDKIMVAYNSVAGSLDLIHHLITHKLIDAKEKVKLLCSANSKDEAAGFYGEIDSDKLPTTINFVTSAYFTGFDINEQYHLVSISDNKSPISSLSDNRLKQIAGRCRPGLLSEYILYNLPNEDTVKKSFTFEQLTAVANAEIQALECIKSNFMADDILSLSHEKIRNLIIEKALPEEHRYIRVKGDSPVISYLNIDAYLEGQRVRKTLFNQRGTLANVLRAKGHMVEEVKMVSTTEVLKVDSKSIGRKSRVQHIINELRLLKPDENPRQLFLLKNIDKFQKEIIEAYSMLYRNIDSKQLIDLMEEKASVGRDNRAFKNFISSAFYFILNPEDRYKREVMKEIVVGDRYTTEELLNKWKDILMGMNFRNINSDSAAIKLSNIHFKLNRWEDKGTRKQLGHKIKNDNPYGLKLTNHLPLVNNQTYINYIFQKPF